MTEQEWLACTDPMPMLAFLRGKASDRKRRLFEVACCYRIWPLLTDERSRAAIEVSERFADAQASQMELDAAKAEAGDAIPKSRDLMRGVSVGTRRWREGQVIQAITRAAFWTAQGPQVTSSVVWATEMAARLRGLSWSSETDVWQCALVRCIFGNPRRPITMMPSPLTDTVLTLGQTIYTDRAFDRLPILADALEEAGCTDAEILKHCRGPGPHVRGCWVVDLVLGKE
jgi:hypothetical protein